MAADPGIGAGSGHSMAIPAIWSRIGLKAAIDEGDKAAGVGGDARMPVAVRHAPYAAVLAVRGAGRGHSDRNGTLTCNKEV